MGAHMAQAQACKVPSQTMHLEVVECRLDFAAVGADLVLVQLHMLGQATPQRGGAGVQVLDGCRRRRLIHLQHSGTLTTASRAAH